MSIEIERAINRQTEAVQDLTAAILQMVETNQKMLEVLIDVMAGDDPDNQPLRDMEGNPV